MNSAEYRVPVVVRVAPIPIAYPTSVVLLPGKHKIRLLVRDQATDRIGATEVPLTVPNFNRQK